MADKGVIFSAAMVRALLDGRKSQTRRLLTKGGLYFNGDRWPKGLSLSEMNLADAWVDDGPSPAGNPGSYLKADWPYGRLIERDEGDDAEWLMARLYPKVQPGDRLYVREAFSYDTLDVDRDGTLPPWYWADGNIADAAQGSGNFTKPKPSIHMPRWASRLTLLVTDVRVQRVGEITRDDCYAEGAITDEWLEWRDDVSNIGMPEGSTIENERDVFARLWNSLHTKPGERWEDNPWIVAVSFSVARDNIDNPLTNGGPGGDAR